MDQMELVQMEQIAQWGTQVRLIMVCMEITYLTTPLIQKRTRLGGLRVSDDAKRIVKDQTISHKFGHYIVAKVLNFGLGVCSVGVVVISVVWVRLLDWRDGIKRC